MSLANNGRTLAVIGLLALGLIGCGGSANPSWAENDHNASDRSPTSDTSSYGTNAITLNILPGSITMSGVDSQVHTAVMPSSWVVKEGKLFTLTVINYDAGSHSITSPKLGIDFFVPAANEDAATKVVTPITSTFTFTAITAGDFHWYCKIPCDGPTYLGMVANGNNGTGYEGIMAGEIVVHA